jgi:hypothetical protein
MSTTHTITRSTRLAGIDRFAARPRIVAPGSDVCAQPCGLGALWSYQPQPMANGTSRDRGGEFGHAGAEARRDAHIRMTSFSAAVRLGAGPG